MAFGLIECQGGFFDPDSDVGNVIGDSCPLRPLWVGKGRIDLPNTTSLSSSSDGMFRGNDDASAQCLAWLGGAMAFVACLSFVVLKAASMDWQIKRLCMMGEWEAEGLRYQGLGFRVIGFRVSRFQGLRYQGLGFRVPGFRVSRFQGGG